MLADKGHRRGFGIPSKNLSTRVEEHANLITWQDLLDFGFLIRMRVGMGGAWQYLILRIEAGRPVISTCLRLE